MSAALISGFARGILIKKCLEGCPLLRGALRRSRVLTSRPLCMLLGDERFDSFNQQRASIRGSGIGPGTCQVEVLLMFQSLAGRTVRDPVGMKLVQLLQPFDDRDDPSESAGRQAGITSIHEPGDNSNQRSIHDS